MKKWTLTLLVLMLAQLACNLPQATPQATPPGLPAVETTLPSTESPATQPLPETATPNMPLAEAIPATATLTETLPPAPSPTFTLEPTVTLTPDPSQLFTEVLLSQKTIYLTCNPREVRFEVATSNPNVYSIIIFLRTRDKITGAKSDWNEGIAMDPLLTAGRFFRVIKGDGLPGAGSWDASWVQYQLIATDKNAVILGRSEVFAENLTLLKNCP